MLLFVHFFQYGTAMLTSTMLLIVIILFEKTLHYHQSKGNRLICLTLFVQKFEQTTPYIIQNIANKYSNCLTCIFFNNIKKNYIPFKILRYKKNQEIKKNGLFPNKINTPILYLRKISMLNHKGIISFFYAIANSDPILCKM